MKWPAVALGAPATLLAAGLAAALVAAAFGHHPMWTDDRLNLSEAAAARDEAEVVRLITHGENPDDPRSVRPGLLFDHAVRLTPLEAAVISQRTTMVERLLASGASMDPVIWNRLRCIAGGSEMPPFLDRRRPPGAQLGCDNVSEP